MTMPAKHELSFEDKMALNPTGIEPPANVKPRAGEHTKGPWSINGGGGNGFSIGNTGGGEGFSSICGQSSVEIGKTFSLWWPGTLPLHVINARRIVACVNALEGVPDDAVEMAGAGLRDHLQLIDQLRAREKELVEALLSLTNAFDLAIAQGKLPGGTQNSQIAQAARAALSKVRGA
jgi:hypothetical protein